MKTFDLDIFQLLILLGSLQGLIFGIVILGKKRFRTTSNTFLGLMVLSLAISNLQHIFIDLNYLDETSFIRKIYIPFQWLFVPFFYLHIKSTFVLKPIDLKLKSYLVSPFFIVSILHIAHFIYKFQDTPVSQMPDYNTKGMLLYTNFASFVFNTILVYFILKMISEYENSIGKHDVKIRKQTAWYKNIIKATVVAALVGILTIQIITWQNVDPVTMVYPFLIMVSVALYYIGYVGVNRATPFLNQKSGSKIPQKGGDLNYQKIITYILEDKPYLEPTFSLQKIADKFTLSSGYVSQLFSAHNKQNFNDYINNLRIEASKKMLIHQDFENYTIESIGLECGFKSKSNFYTAFKKFTHQTPKEYVKTHKKRPVS